MPYIPLSIRDVTSKLELHKRNADAMRLYSHEDCDKFQQAYDGGKYLVNPDNDWVTRQPGEDMKKWEERKKRLRLMKNPCRLIPDVITDYMCNGSIRIVCKDQAVQDVVEQQYSKNKWPTQLRREIERLASIYGTIIVGPFISERRHVVKMRWFRSDHVYPILCPDDAEELDGFMVIRRSPDFESQYLKYEEVVDIWTLGERARIIQGRNEETGRDEWNVADEDIVNPLGTIPFVKFDARPSADVDSWFALSDIHEAKETLKLILEQGNSLAEVVRMQGFSTLVVKGDPNTKDIEVSPTSPIVLGDLEHNQDAFYIVPAVPFKELQDVNEADYRSAFENENVPWVIVSPTDQPESGVAEKIKGKRIIDMAEERKTRHIEAEKALFALTYMTAVIMDNPAHVYTWEQAIEEMDRIIDMLEVSFVSEYNPADEATDIDVLNGLKDLDLVSPLEAWQRIHPDGTEDDWKEWLERKRDQELLVEEYKPVLRTQVPVNGQAGPDEDEDIDTEEGSEDAWSQDDQSETGQGPEEESADE